MTAAPASRVDVLSTNSSPTERRTLTRATPYVGLEPYAQRWVELVAAARGTTITHFAYRMDAFELSDRTSPLRALCEACRDTQVTVVLSSHAAGVPNRSTARALERAGARVLWSRAPRLGSMHLKATVFGSRQRRVMLGSADLWSARLDRTNRRFRNGIESHEFGVELEGILALKVDEQLQRVVLDSHGTPSADDAPVTQQYNADVILTGFPPRGSNRNFLLEERLCAAVRRATRYIYIEDQYFSLCRPQSGWESRLLGELESAVARGVGLVVALPSRDWTHGPRSIMGLGTSYTVNRLLAMFGGTHPNVALTVRHGREYPVHAHSKLLVIDGTQVVTGSANLCRRSFEYDSELTVFIHDGALATAALAALLPDVDHFGDASNLSAPTIASSSVLERITEPLPIARSVVRRRLLQRVVDPGTKTSDTVPHVDPSDGTPRTVLLTR